MRILIFNWKDINNPEAGGAEVFTHEISKRLVKKGHEVTLFTSQFKGSQKEEIVDGVRIVRDGGKISVYLKAKQHYKKVFSKEGYDVVIDEINTRPFFVHKFVTNGEKVFALIHQLAREYWFHETRFPINYIGYYFLENRWLRQYTEIPTITISESTRKDLIEMDFKKIFLIPEGLGFKPLKKIPKKADKPVVIFVGRLKKAKRPDHAIEAFKIIKETIPEAELWIVGEGYFRKKLQKKLVQGVKFFGHVPEKKKFELLKKAWVLINPSVREGWGINVIEANSVGTPCVAYDVPGLRDSVLNGETGMIVNSGSNELAETIIPILNDYKLRRRISKNALTYSKKFNWSKSSEEFFNIMNGE